MKVGYLHIGREGGGVRRYGGVIAAGARQRGDLDVIEADAGERGASAARLAEVARSLAGADVVHIQWKPNDWGGGRGAFAALRAFAAAMERPLVATLHDVWERQSLRRRWLDSDARALRWLGRHAARIVVHGDEEQRRLAGLVPAERVAIVPHFVEERALVDADAARATLGLAGRRVITLLGFMVRRKGYRLTIESLPKLPDDVLALFAGAPMTGREARADELMTAARELGVESRVRITGYVAADMLDAALAATHVAICPFRDLSASGSLSTWISTGRPIVTSDLPQFREYDRMVPGALRIFRPLTADALATGVRQVLDEGPPDIDPRVLELRDRLLTPRTVDRYVEVYRESRDARSLASS